MKLLLPLARLIATGAYTGYAPVAPGTAGTIPAVALAILIARATCGLPLLHALLLAVITAVGVWAADVHARALGKSDPGQVVIDEVAGYLFAVAFLPLNWPVLIAGFFVFRLFDIVKPPPCRQLERLHGGVGIVADDVAAGLYTHILLRILLLAGVLPASSGLSSFCLQ